MAFSAILLYVMLTLTTVFMMSFKRHFAYWKRRGIPHDAPNALSGSMKGFQITRPIRSIMKDYYDKYKGTGPFAGFFFYLKPAVFVLDLNLAKNILIKDFHNFTDRGLFHNERNDPLTAHLFALDGAKWKNIRNELSPIFTSENMKLMFPAVMEIADQLIETISTLMLEESMVEVKDILARFTADVIGICAFGVDCNSLKDPNAEFRVMGQKAVTLTRHSKSVEGFFFSFPDLARKLRMRRIHEDVHQYFMKVVRETVEYREKNFIKRNDFMDFLIETMNSENGMTIEEVAAQAFIFFLGGFETSSSTMGFALFELARNKKVQDKLRAEINRQFKKNNGIFTYECITEMHYMEKVMKETLRKYSVVINLFRKALNEYPTSVPKYTIPKGALVLIPADAIHRDPDIYPKPEKFDPERFTAEEIQKRHPVTWLPFGDGPRNCIGLRFGKMQTYVGLSMLLRNFKFHFCEKTQNPLEMDVSKSFLSAKGGIYLRVEHIRSENVPM